MSDSQQEPSMEEILASIRKIISEDGEEEGAPQEAAAPEPPPPAPEPEPAPAPPPEPEPEPEPMDLDEEVEDEELLELEEEIEEDLLELDDEFEEEPVELELIDAPEPEPEPEPIPEPEPEPEPAPPPPPPPMPQPAAAPVIPPSVDPEERVVSNLTSNLGAQSFASLERAIRIGNSGETLEGIVKALLKPMLKSWLDENLPGLVERLVDQEIQKMSNQGRRRHADEDEF